MIPLYTDELDDDWNRLGDVYEVTRKPRGAAPSADEVIPFIPMELIPQGGDFEAKFLDKKADSIASGTYFEVGDVLVAKITPSFENGKQALIQKLPRTFGIATTEVIPLRSKDAEQDSRFLFYFLLHPEVRHFVAEKMEGATGRQRVPERVLLDLPFPSFSKAKQTAISDVLYLTRRLVAAEQALLTNTMNLRNATMALMFSGGDTDQSGNDFGPVPEGWLCEPIGNHFTVGSGGTPSRAKAEYWTGGTIPWVKTTEVNYGVIVDTEEHITEAGLQSSAAKMLQANTLLMAMYGQGVTRGRIAMLGLAAACNQACASITPADEVILIKYLYHYLAYKYAEIRQLAHGGQQQNLNADIVRRIPVAYPPVKVKQASIIAVLDCIEAKATVHRQKIDLLEKLFVSLIDQFMSGDLCVDSEQVRAYAGAQV
jgi:type I restriction enzyme S subunit